MKPVSIVVREDATVPFDRWFATELGQILERTVPRGLARKAIVAGLVAVGGRIERNPGLMLRRGPSVFVRGLEWLPKPEAGRRLRILHEDDSVIAVDKPSGLPTHETKDPDRPSLTRLVELHLGRRVFVHHRLDAGTSGVVLFAKASAANASLARSFAEREIRKTYVVLVQRPQVDWPTEMTIDSPILVLPNGTVRVDSSGSPARTAVRVLARTSQRLLIEAIPVTGRKHQIRVHLASIGAPVIGDSRYGGPISPAGRLMLHAERLELDHPKTAERLVIVSPRPEIFTAQPVRAGAKADEARGSEPEPRRAADPSPRPSGPRSQPAAGSRPATRSRKKAVRQTRARGKEPGSHH